MHYLTCTCNCVLWCVDAAQEALRKVVKGVGGWDHASFRAFVNERKTSDARGIVDGDLVESFLDVGKEVQTQVGCGGN